MEKCGNAAKIEGLRSGERERRGKRLLHAPGDVVRVRVARDGRPLEVQVRLGAPKE